MIPAILIFNVSVTKAQEVGTCVCQLQISGGITSESTCNTLSSNLGVTCNWLSDESTCKCPNLTFPRDMRENECKGGPDAMLKQEYPEEYGKYSPLFSLTGASLSGSCTWLSRGSLPGSEAPVTAPGGDGSLVFEPPLGSVSIQEVIANVIRAVLGVVGSITLLMFIIGGFIWMTAAGNEDRIKLGRNILTWTVLGLVVIFSAYAITEFILRSLLE